MDDPAPSRAPSSIEPAIDLALLTDRGCERDANEDSCGRYDEESGATLFMVADGLGGYEGGAVASAVAVETTIEAYRDSPKEWGAGKRLYRAVQRANIEVYNRALSVPELRRMATTLTAAVVEDGMLAAAHVGDCRLYLARRGKITQITQDHTMVAEQIKRGLMTAESARAHPESSIVLRNIGHELIVTVARITLPLVQGDRIILCSDGLYNVLHDAEIEMLTRGLDAETACRRLIDTANERGTADNLSCAFFKMNAKTPYAVAAPGWRERIRGFFGGGT